MIDFAIIILVVWVIAVGTSLSNALVRLIDAKTKARLGQRTRD